MPGGIDVANFDLFLPVLLRFEGGYVDDPEDPGGETNKGITMSVFQDCSHELLGIDPTSDTLRALTDGQAGIIYRARYWNKMQADAIALQQLANIVCDFFVNAGTRATKLLQHVLNGMGANVVEDGVVGLASIQAGGRFSARGGLPAVQTRPHQLLPSARPEVPEVFARMARSREFVSQPLTISENSECVGFFVLEGKA
jgi:lysozyme family protein